MRQSAGSAEGTEVEARCGREVGADAIGRLPQDIRRGVDARFGGQSGGGGGGEGAELVNAGAGAEAVESDAPEGE